MIYLDVLDFLYMKERIKIFFAHCAKNKRSEELRKKNRRVTTPTQTRPFTKLSPEEKVEAYHHRDKKYRYESVKYRRLVSKLETSKACFNIREK